MEESSDTPTQYDQDLLDSLTYAPLPEDDPYYDQSVVGYYGWGPDADEGAVAGFAVLTFIMGAGTGFAIYWAVDVYLLPLIAILAAALGGNATALASLTIPAEFTALAATFGFSI